MFGRVVITSTLGLCFLTHCKSLTGTQESEILGTEVFSNSSFLAKDLAHLETVIKTQDQNCTNLAANKEWTPQAILDRLYDKGIEAPPSPRAELGHRSLQEGGYKALRRAYFVASHKDSPLRVACTRELTEILDGWSRFPPPCFTFDSSCPLLTPGRKVPSTDNVNLEATWLLGNLIRAAMILERFGFAAKDPQVQKVLTQFKPWSENVVASYVNFRVFSAGNTNRKAAQIETMLRQAIMVGNSDTSAALVKSFATLLGTVKPRGELCADTLRDKYHPQFFLGSALNIEQIIRTQTSFQLIDPPINFPTQSDDLCPSDEKKEPRVNFKEYAEDAEAKEVARRTPPQDPKKPKAGRRSKDNLWLGLVTLAKDQGVCQYPPDFESCDKAEDQGLNPKKEDTSLERALRFAAVANVKEGPPPGYESPLFDPLPRQDWRPAYDIGIWHSARLYFERRGHGVPEAVHCMEETNYYDTLCGSRFDLGKAWGYSALTEAFKL